MAASAGARHAPPRVVEPAYLPYLVHKKATPAKVSIEVSGLVQPAQLSDLTITEDGIHGGASR
jgi:hypothetical protein